MPAPNILPPTLPKGTQFSIGSDVYEFISVATRGILPSFFGQVPSYVGDVKHLLSGQNWTGYSVYAHSIHWEEIGSIKENSDIDSCTEAISEAKYCLWCNKLLGSNQNSPFCAVGKVYCEDYYLALKERMAVDFRKPNEALDSEKESVKRWVNNLLRIK